MKKLVKPKVSVENITNEMIEALCEYEGCGGGPDNGNCRERGWLGGCSSVNEDESDDTILF